MSLRSKLSVSSPRHEGLEDHDVTPEKELGQEFIIERFVHCKTVLYIGNVPESLSYLIIFVIWMYRCHKIKTTYREITLFNSRSHQINIGQTIARCTMFPIYGIVSVTALSISTVIGFFTNMFIIVAHAMERTTGRTTNPSELILFILGLFNITFQCIMAANDMVLFFWSDLYFSGDIYTIFSVLLLFTIFSSFWFTFCLCGFYYIMLVTSEQSFFMRLKRDVSEVVPKMLISAVLLSLALSVPVVWNINKNDYPILNGNLTYNSTVEQSKPHMSLIYLLVTSIIGCSIPLLLVAVSNILLIKSLCVHAKHFGKFSIGMTMQSVDASVSAASTVTSLLLLYFTFYFSEILLFTFHRYYFKAREAFNGDSLWFSVCLIVVHAYSPVQSVILILGSPKLKSTLIRFLAFIRSNQSFIPHKRFKPRTAQVFTLQFNSDN